MRGMGPYQAVKLMEDGNVGNERGKLRVVDKPTTN